MDGQGRPWTIGMTWSDSRNGHRLTHAHFENYQNS
jgi:hypothetical protein